MGWDNIAQGEPASGDALGSKEMILQTESLRQPTPVPALQAGKRESMTQGVARSGLALDYAVLALRAEET